MRITCKYCGYSEEYPNGIGWYPGQVGEMCNHILEKHVKFDTDQAMDQDGKLAEVTVGFRIEEMAGDDEMSVSEEMWRKTRL